ncbi:MAG: S8 family serine peptidase [Chloroflexi bacterium]|nr:S8 family serine peptidase [Chloroflexota bacterium]
MGLSVALAAGAGSTVSATTLSVAERLAIRQATAETVGRLQAELQQGGTRRVIVLLDLTTVPESKMPRSQVAAQRDRIARAQARLLALPDIASAHLLRKLTTLPVISLEVDSAALAALAESAGVLSIQEDIAVPPALDVSGPLVGATAAWAAGYSGTGQAVAILDTGVDSTHPFLTNKVVLQACFSNGGSNGAASLCPGDVGSLTGVAGAGEECSGMIYGCNHGTHVAGIAAGRGGTFSGIGRDASIIAVQVFTEFSGTSCTNYGLPTPCALSYTSDQIAALEWLATQVGANSIASANMSLGGGTYSDEASCDAANAAEKGAIDSLRAAGVATVIAAGNGYVTTGISSPGCISSAVAVGATNDADVVVSFSNSSPMLEFWAPGYSINSSLPGTGYGSMSGTSMAAPHVAGAWAVLKSKAAGATVNQILSALTASGVSVTDTRNSVAKPRIQVDAALVALDGLLTPTATQTETATLTVTPTPSPTATVTLAPTPALTETHTPTATVTETPTSTLTPSATPTETLTPTPTEAPTDTPTATPSETPTATPTGTSVGPLTGDVNSDGSVNVLDVQLCVNVFLGTETDPGLATRSDLNIDGVVNVIDVQQIVNVFLAG